MLHLSVKTRDIDKEKAKNLLKQGVIPAVLYGPKDKPKTVAVNYKKFNDAYKEAGESTLIALDIDKKSESKDTADDTDVSKEDNVVLIRDLQVHPVTGNFMHVDFYKLPLDQAIEISIPIEGVNEAPAVKEQGGILVANLHEINIKALPTELIHEIAVDLSGLKEIGDSILVKDLNVSNNVEILADEEEVVFAIEEPREEEPEEEEVTEEEALESIKTEGEEKREEREAEKAEEPDKGAPAPEAKKEEKPTEDEK